MSDNELEKADEFTNNRLMSHYDSGELIMKFFRFSHLKEPLRSVSRMYANMALEVVMLPRMPERTVALRKLLESKDAAVRTMVP